MIIPNIWENKKCSKPPTSNGVFSMDFFPCFFRPQKIVRNSGSPSRHGGNSYDFGVHQSHSTMLVLKPRVPPWKSYDFGHLWSIETYDFDEIGHRFQSIIGLSMRLIPIDLLEISWNLSISAKLQLEFQPRHQQKNISGSRQGGCDAGHTQAGAQPMESFLCKTWRQRASAGGFLEIMARQSFFFVLKRF